MTACPRCHRPTPRPGGHTTRQGCVEAAARHAVQRLVALSRGLSPPARRFVLAARRTPRFRRADLVRLAALLEEYCADGSLSAELAGQLWLL